MKFGVVQFPGSTCDDDAYHAIGSDTALVAPVRAGDSAYVAAGSVITENVPPDALAIARGRQANTPGWARAKRAEQERAANVKASNRSSRAPAKRRSPNRSATRRTKSHRR